MSAPKPPASSRVFGPVVEHDVPTLVRLIHHAFASTPDAEEKWIRPSGLDNFRGVRETERGPLSSCLLRIEMGQFFGGQSVPMLGIAAVAVSPESRGQGTARWMMGEAMREAREDGFALSGLYASTQGLYRQAGYEQAGYRVTTKVLPHRIDVRAREPQVRPLTAHDDQSMAACYARFAQTFPGMLDRCSYIWRRVREFRDKKFNGFGIEGPGGSIEGYVFLLQNRTTDGIEIDVSDLAFTSARAGQRLLGFLANFSTTTKEIIINGAPLHPILSLMTSHHHTIAKSEIWMLRITDLAKALTQRGYPRHVTATIQLNIHDPIVRENDGSWTLHVEHGRAEVKKEAAMRPTITCEISALAPIYSGFYTATQAALLGWVEGEKGALAAADAIFGGVGTPWMTDFF
jgi:predicted acetyltransferase